MGSVELRMEGEDGDGRIAPLAATTVIGRAAQPPWRLTSDRVSTRWIEVRWFPDVGWAFRYLGADQLTTARHRRLAGLPQGWFSLVAGDCVTHAAARLKVLDDSPPTPLVVDVTAGVVVNGGTVTRLVERRPDGTWPVDADTHPDRDGPLADGEVFTVDGRPFRYHDAAPPKTTEAPTVDLEGRGAELRLVHRDGRSTLVLGGGLRDVTLRSSKLRVLLPYIRERLDGDADGGWLSVYDVIDDLARLDGDPLRPARIGEYRGWIRGELTRRGVANAGALFEKKRVVGPSSEDRTWLTRIGLPPGRLLLDEG